MVHLPSNVSRMDRFRSSNLQKRSLNMLNDSTNAENETSNQTVSSIFETPLKRRNQRMNAHDFTDFWHHHTPHSLFYPAANQPPLQAQPTPTTLQTLCSRAVTDSQAPQDAADTSQLQPNQQTHCTELVSAAQLFNTQQLDGHNQLRSIDQNDVLSRSHQQQLPPGVSIAANNPNQHHFQMPPLANPLMGISAHGQAAQLLAAGFPSSFGGFANPAAPFIPFNLMAQGVGTASVSRLSPPQSATTGSTTTIFDLDQPANNPLPPHNVASLVGKNLVTLEKTSPKRDTPPTLQLMTIGNNEQPIVSNRNEEEEDDDQASNSLLHSNEHQKKHAIAQIPTETKIEMMGNAPLCQVCQSGPSNGLHFGAPRTCAACAAFFRRSISDQKKYVCKRPQRCSLRVTDSQGYRKICRNCRMKRCLEIGMMPEKVQHKRHRREVLGIDTFHPLQAQIPVNQIQLQSHQQHKIHQLQQAISTKLERPPQSNSNGVNELTPLSLHEELARQHYANQMLAATHNHQHQLNSSVADLPPTSNTWTLAPLGNSVPQQLQNCAPRL